MASSPYIVCAALYYEEDDIIITGPRHFDRTMIKVIQKLGLKSKVPKQGFVDQNGYFRNRKEAMKVVRMNHQQIDSNRNGSDPERLFSEGLY